jgi:hypothetical protein
MEKDELQHLRERAQTLITDLEIQSWNDAFDPAILSEFQRVCRMLRERGYDVLTVREGQELTVRIERVVGVAA